MQRDLWELISISVTGDAALLSPTITRNPVTATTQKDIISAHTKASRDTPAYFEVKAGSGTVNMYTSSKIDWVVEYIDDRGNLHTINENGALNPEEIIIQARGKPIYVKVYPYKYSDSGEVFLYAENAQSVRVSPTIPAQFGPGLFPCNSRGDTKISCGVMTGFVFLILILLRPYRDLFMISKSGSNPITHWSTEEAFFTFKTKWVCYVPG